MTTIAPDAPLSEAELSAASEAKASAHRVIVPAPEKVVYPRKKLTGEPFKLRCPAPRQWEYRTLSGALYGIVCRWDRKDAKIVLPLVYAEIGTEQQWAWAGFQQGCPLYRSPELAAHGSCPVLIVSGEKTADAAAKYLPDNWVCVTWQGGDGAWRKSDWTGLDGHPCVIWPDNDESGWKAGGEIYAHLQANGVGAAVIPAIKALPEKWDLADPLPDGIEEQTVKDLLMKTLARAAVPEPVPPPASNVIPLPEPVKKANGKSPGRQRGFVSEEFQALGFNDQVFYFISKYSQQIHGISAGNMTKRETWLQMVPDFSYWSTKYGGDAGGIPWHIVGVDFMKLCYDAGVYMPSKIRGRGAWIDEGRIILHTGDALLVDGERVNPAAIKSRYIYPRAESFAELEDVDPLDDKSAKQFRTICNMPLWREAISGDFLTGIVATSVVCGGLKWRSNCWITGPSGSGKSYVLDNIVGAALGDIAIYPAGASSESGIRRTLEQDARPVVYDEAEGEGQAGTARRDMIIELMRLSAHEGRGKIFKAAGGSETVSYSIRSQFILGSIGVGIKKAADESRTLILTLKAQNAEGDAAKSAQAAHFSKLVEAVAKLPPDLPQRLLLRMTKLLPVLRANVEIFSSTIASRLGNRRLGDLVGTPLAGCWTMLNANEIDAKTVESYLGRFDWANFTREKQVKEDDEVISVMSNHMIRVLLNGSNATQDRPIGELLALASEAERDERVTPDNASSTLSRIGIKYDHKTRGVFIAHGNQRLDDIMRRSSYAQGYLRILQSLPQARSSGKIIRIGASTAWATWLPVGMFTEGAEKQLEPTLGYDEADDYDRN